ncbi:MAG: hypothetical protein ABIN57_00860 [Chitinophagaceae bacterium]
MKTAFCIGVLICFSFSTNLFAQNYKSSVGLRLSSNAAAINHSLTGKYFFADKVAVEGLFSFGNSFAVGAMVEKHNAIGGEGLAMYYGGGLYGGFGPSKFGAHGVVGLDYKWPAIPLNLSIDWKPELSISREFGFEPAAVGLSARYIIF